MLLIMECILEANPRPEIRWFRGETSIEETTPRYKMSMKKTARDQFTLTLTVRAPTQEDGGQYRCNAVNAYGESNANIALNFAGNNLLLKKFRPKKMQKYFFTTLNIMFKTDKVVEGVSINAS